MGCLIKINFRDCVIDSKNNNDDIAYNVMYRTLYMKIFEHNANCEIPKYEMSV